MARRSRADKNRQRELEDSCVNLRHQLGDDDSVPSSITFSAGQEVKIDTNCYSLTLNVQSKITQYAVDFEPEILSAKVCTHFLYSAICGGGRQSENARWQQMIFDGQRILYSTFTDLEHKYEVPGRTGKPVVVKITRTRDVSPDDGNSLLAIYNTAFRQAYRHLGLTNFRRKWLNESTTKTAGAFRIVEGFLPSIVSLAGGLSYVVDVATRIDRDGSLYDFIKHGISQVAARAELTNAFRSLQLTTIHRDKPRQVIASNATILWDRPPNSITFKRVDRKTNEARDVSVAEYFAEAYNVQLRPDDVIIQSATRGPAGPQVSLYPSSVLKIAGISEAERRDPRVMREIAMVTRIEPATRKDRLQQFVESLRTNQEASSFLARWGFVLGESRQPRGRLIAVPRLVMCKQRTAIPVDVTIDDRLKFQHVLKDYSLCESVAYRANYLIVAAASSRQQVERDMIPMLADISRGLGMALPPPDVEFVENTHPNEYCKKIAAAVEQKVPSFVVVILPGADSTRYNGVKDFLTVHVGIPSQFVKSDTLCGDRSKYTNIAIQIAAKTGGVPYRVSPTQLPLARTMVVGIALHAARGGGAPVAAAVASRNASLTRFYSDSGVSDDDGPVIRAEFIREFMENAIAAYRRDNNDEWPRRVVVYRDGVSYGIMPKVKSQEVGTFREALSGAPEPVSLTFLVAHKHVAIRILLNRGGRVQNAGPGTVVTDSIGAKGVAEFYLISHFANQGSASPTRYTLVHHAPAVWKDDEIVLLTHYQTLQYPNWAGSIRIPACLMLAERLAEFTRTRLGSSAAAPSLKGYLHFL
jgi:aubergine-like protein